MRILCYYPGSLYNPKRGTPLRVYHICRFLSQHAEVVLVAKKLPEDWQGEGHEVPSGRCGLNWLCQAKALRRLIQQHKPDTVYSHVHNALLPTVLGVSKGVPKYIDLHGLPHAERHFGAVRYWCTDLWYKALLRCMTGITTVCNPLTGYYKSVCPKGHTLHGGVDTQYVDSIDGESLKKDVPVVCYSGNVSSYQGTSMLFEALATVDAPWHLLMVCSSKEEEVRAALRDHGIEDRSTIVCGVEHKRALALVKGADIAVLPRPHSTITHYAFASKLPEYLATGSAVVATDVSDATACVVPGETGWIVEPGSSQALADTLQTALLDAEKRSVYGSAGANHVREQFDWRTLTADLIPFLS